MKLQNTKFPSQTENAKVCKICVKLQYLALQIALFCSTLCIENPNQMSRFAKSLSLTPIDIPTKHLIYHLIASKFRAYKDAKFQIPISNRKRNSV